MQRTYLTTGVGLQDSKGDDLLDLDAVLDCDEDIGITVDGESIRDPAGPEGLPFVGSYYEVFPDHLVSQHSGCIIWEHCLHILGESCSFISTVRLAHQI
jgi:hypothetical protein